MLTHKQVNCISVRWKRTAGAFGPKLIKARSVSDASLIAVHLLNPTQCELDDAFNVACRDNFPAVVIHTRRTFGKSTV